MNSKIRWLTRVPMQSSHVHKGGFGLHLLIHLHASALRVIYQSLNSPGQLTKWTSNGGDPCGDNWKGVKCSGSTVIEINLSGLGLSGNLGNNNLGNQISYTLPANLQRLNIAGCGFSGNLPYSISLMTSLKYLNVARNQVNGELQDMFGILSALSTLDMSFNSLTSNLLESSSSLSSATDMQV